MYIFTLIHVYTFQKDHPAKAIDNSLVWHSVGKKQYDIDQSNELHDYSLTQTEQYFSYIKIYIKNVNREMKQA
jgi:hypothetical protein